MSQLLFEPIFWGLERNGSQYFCTDAAASFENAPVVEAQTNISILPFPFLGSEEREKYDEIREALILVKKYLRKEYNQVQELISKGKDDIIPIFKLDENQNLYFEESGNPERRNYAFVIKYDDLSNLPHAPNQVIEGNTKKRDFAHIPVVDTTSKVISLQFLRTPLNAPDDKKNDPEYFINKSDYISIATDSNNYKPKEIAAQYIPKIGIKNHGNALPALVAINDNSIINSGLPAQEPNLTIQISQKFRQQSSQIFKSTDLVVITITGANNIKTEKPLTGNLRGVSYRSLKISQVIAHELGHAYYSANNALESFAWAHLDDWFQVNQTDPDNPSQPSMRGGGHLEGDPSGNSAAENSYHIGKNMIENDLWKQGMKMIDKNGIFNKDSNIKKLKVDDFLPQYLTHETQFGDIVFFVNTYLNGNLFLTSKELPPSINEI